MVENSLLLDSPSHWCRRRGCRWCNLPPKVLIWWKSGQNLIKSRQNSLKSGQNLWGRSKTPWKSEKKWHPTCFDLKIMAPEMTRKTFFMEVTQRVNQDLFHGGHLIWNIFRASLGNSGKNSLASPKICLLLYLCPIPKLSLHNSATFCLQQKLCRDLPENLTF